MCKRMLKISMYVFTQKYMWERFSTKVDIFGETKIILYYKIFTFCINGFNYMKFGIKN